MLKAKRKIYKLVLWLYSDNAKLDIDEFNIKRKGSDSIQTEDDEKLYCWMIDKPEGGIVVGDNCIEVEMLTENLKNIDVAIQIMIEEGRKKINEQIKDFNNMYGELNLLGNYEKDIFLHTKEEGYFKLKKNDSEILASPFRIDMKDINIKDLYSSD